VANGRSGQIRINDVTCHASTPIDLAKTCQPSTVNSLVIDSLHAFPVHFSGSEFECLFERVHTSLQFSNTSAATWHMITAKLNEVGLLSRAYRYVCKD